MTGRILKGPEFDFTPTSTIGEFFFNSAQKFNNRICHIDFNTNRKETYSSLNQRCVRVALAMSELGITSEDVIATCSFVNLDLPVPVLASYYLAAKVANLDPNLSLSQTTHLLSLISPRMIFVQEESVDLIEKSLLEAGLKSEIVVFGKSLKYKTFSDMVQPKPNEEKFKPTRVDLEETIIIFFSSGTTGLPKAICHSHRSFLNIAFSFGKSGFKFDVSTCFSSLYWISAHLFLSNAFISGGTRIVGLSISKPEQVFQSIEKYKISVMFLAPVLTYYLTEFPEYEKYDTSSLFSVITGGTAIRTTQLRKIKSVFKHSHVVYVYGATEIGVSSIVNALTDPNLLDEKIGSPGRPALGFLIKIVDVETEKILGPNENGEIYIKSNGNMSGYYKTESSNAFDQDGFVKTGDIGYYDDDHCLFIVDRIKEMFKYMSWHIVPSSIEAVLLENPAVKEAVVFGLPKSEEEGEIPTASVVLKEGFCVSEQEIGDFVADRVSDKEKLRGGVYFVEELFRTTTGKVMRKENRDYVIEMLKGKGH